MRETVWTPVGRSDFARSACDVVEMVRRDTEDSCTMDGETIERIASEVPAMMEGWWAMAAHQELCRS